MTRSTLIYSRQSFRVAVWTSVHSMDNIAESLDRKGYRVSREYHVN